MKRNNQRLGSSGRMPRIMLAPRNVSNTFFESRMHDRVRASLSNSWVEIDDCASSFHRARSHFEEEGDLARLGDLHFRRGMGFLAKKEYENALREFELTTALSETLPSARLACLAKLGKANVYYEQQDFRVALRLADQSLEGFWLQEDNVILAEVFLLKGKICRALKKFEFAEWFFQTSLRLYSSHENREGVAECNYQLGMLLELCGRHTEARRMFERSSATRDALAVRGKDASGSSGNSV
jgi:tetratricopeptide (TPR) repeat protein